jgi:putative transposase
MKRSKLAEEQIAFILRQSKEDTAIGEILRQTGISDSMLMPSEVSRLHQLMEENDTLKKIIADLLQYKKMLQDSRRKH